MQSWVDGQPAHALASLKDRGLAYGDGLFETLAVKAGQPLLLDLHMQRLAQGCSRLAIVADHSLIRSELLASELPDSGFVSQRLGITYSIVCASPAYVKANGTNTATSVRAMAMIGPLTSCMAL